MKQHQWTNPLLSMLASTAMCAILSFNQPTLHSVDSNELGYQSNLLITKHSQNEPQVNAQVKQQLEMALTLELFAAEQKMSDIKHNPSKFNSRQEADKQECGEQAIPSVKTRYIMPMVRNTNSI